MNRRLMYRRLAVAAIFAVGAYLASAQVPADRLMVPPAGAEKFVIVSAAGTHGYSSVWKADDGSILSRESILLRGMVWEQDEAIHFGRNGLPDRIVIRGSLPAATPPKPSPFPTARRAGNRRSIKAVKLTTEPVTISPRAAP